VRAACPVHLFLLWTDHHNINTNGDTHYEVCHHAVSDSLLLLPPTKVQTFLAPCSQIPSSLWQTLAMEDQVPQPYKPTYKIIRLQFYTVLHKPISVFTL
jgi:uncharacterized membrane protein